MRSSETLNELAAALAKAQGLMSNATLNKVNPHFRSKYADLAAIRDAVTVPLASNGLAVVQIIGSDEHGAFLTTRMVHASGQWIESIHPLPNSAKPQEFGSALTYARRYSLAALCGISAEEDDDANGANETRVETTRTPQQQSRTATPQPKNGKTTTEGWVSQVSERIKTFKTERQIDDWIAANEANLSRLRGADAKLADDLDGLILERRGELKPNALQAG